MNIAAIKIAISKGTESIIYITPYIFRFSIIIYCTTLAMSRPGHKGRYKTKPGLFPVGSMKLFDV
jgi:hypothetical protein